MKPFFVQTEMVDSRVTSPGFDEVVKPAACRKEQDKRPVVRVRVVRTRADWIGFLLIQWCLPGGALPFKWLRRPEWMHPGLFQEISFLIYKMATVIMKNVRLNHMKELIFNHFWFTEMAISYDSAK